MNKAEYHPNHFAEFEKHKLCNEIWPGNKIKGWWNDVTNNESCNLDDDRVTRERLKIICRRNSGYSNKECLGAVMAWGGQNREHGKTLFSRYDEIDNIIQALRASDIGHIQAYKQLHGLWEQKRALGMGAAYFTKLIFFCHPDHKGYIMDQWTSKSVNLLCQRPVVHLNAGHVSKKNDYNVYAEFCRIVEDIALKLGITAEQAEMAMFSKGGRVKAPWRQHVVNPKNNA